MTESRGLAADAGQQFGRFVVQHELGRGAMGRVYRVTDSLSNEELALKSLVDEAVDQVYFLKREFRTLAELQHPNLVQFHELFSGEGATYFTMELIDGEPFGAGADNTRGPGTSIDYHALGEAALQLVDGVDYLHARGKLHRDLKPSNVLVASDGRVVLLDFGLATSAVTGSFAGDELVGTLAYMAPECFFRAAPAPAADWYAVGVMLYEALTGRLPFPSSQTHVLAKQRGRFVASSEAAPQAPAGLAALVDALLAPEPAARPSAEIIRSQLRQQPRSPARVASTSRQAFVGRNTELAALDAALDAALASGPGLVMLEGRSGEGKTTLIDHFVQRVESEREIAVFRGRCHPSEFLAFKALDGVVDELSQYLASLGDAAAAYLGPQHLALCRVFPVLARVGVQSSVQAKGQATRDADVRRAAFDALRELLQQVSTRRPVIIWVDDVQWGQEDGGRLLCELLRPTAAARILFILSFRSDERTSSHCLRVIDQATAAPDLQALRVAPVSIQPFEPEEARQLVLDVMSLHSEAEPAVAEACSDLVVQSGQGNAFILTEFARHVARCLDEGNVSVETDLSDMLQHRFERLPDLARRIASMAAIAARPIAREVLLGASQADVRGAAMLQMLTKSCLLRPVDVDTQSSYVIYHDQIRQALLRVMPTRDQVDGHARLAEILLASETADPEHVLEHLIKAEQRLRAAPFAFESALRAARTLAFESAGELFALSLELGYTGEAAWRVQTRQAEALANAGRGQRSAEVYLAASAAVPAGDGSASDLQRRAAEQLLHAGCLSQGQRVLGELLAGIGVELPKSTLAATLRSVSGRLWINARGRKYNIVPSDRVDSKALARVDLLWAGTTGLSLINHTQSDAICVQLLGEALKLGERSRIARVLGFEAASEASIGGFLAGRSLRTLDEARRLAAEGSDAYDRAFVLQAASVVHWFQERWLECVEDAERSIELYRSLDRGTQWEQSVVQSFRLSALAQLGRFTELADQIPHLLHEAEVRGDIFAAAVLDGLPSACVWIARDNAERALEVTRQAVQPWPKTLFLTPHYRHLLSVTNALLYQGKHREAFEQLGEIWPAVRKARFLLLSFIGSELRFLRARALLAQRAASTNPRERRELLGVLQAETRSLGRAASLHAKAASSCLQAGLHEQAGSAPRAARSLGSAAELFERLQMNAAAQSCRLVQAKLTRDSRGLLDAEAQLSGMGIARPERFARCFTVGDVRAAS